MADDSALRARNNIPASLRALKRWCTWKLVENAGGRPTKVPDQSTRELGKLRTFAEVAAADGVGFVVTDGVLIDDLWLVLLDIDACVNPVTREIASWAERLLHALGLPYSEFSPSGTGLRTAVLLKQRPSLRPLAKLPWQAPPGVTKEPSCQLFGLGPAGYVTMTGKHVKGTDSELSETSQDSWETFVKIAGFDAVGDAGEPLPRGDGVQRTHEQVLQELGRTERGRELAAGRWEGLGYRSSSDGYFALVILTLRACGLDAEQAIEFLLSAATPWGRGEVGNNPEKYQREKWVEREVRRAHSKAAHRLVDATAVFEPVAVEAKNPGKLLPGYLRRQPPPRDYLLRYPLDRDTLEQDGFAPMGVPAFISSEGGVGKTNMLLALAVSVITGRPWMGFEVDEAHRGQRCLLVLAEEKAAEVERRLFAIGQHMMLSDEECELVERQLVVFPMAGKPCALMAEAEDMQPHATAGFAQLKAFGEANGPWALVALDPLARLFPRAESQNELATFAVQQVEQLCELPGSPLVALAHHSSKMSRRNGEVDARGVTGLTDACRWALTLRHLDNGDVELLQSKANYSKPMLKGIRLVRVEGAGGLLRRASDEEVTAMSAEQEKAQEEELAARASAMVERLRELQEKGEKVTNAKMVFTGLRKDRGPAVLDWCMAKRWIVKRGREYQVGPDAPLV